MEQRREASALQHVWEWADYQRRLRGAVLDRLGLGPETTASREAGAWATARLLAYQAPEDTPVLLLVPAPIKSAYIFDVAPEVSVVRRGRAAGLQVYLLEWQRPLPGDEALGLAAYADEFILRCLDAIAAETRQPNVFLAGHSLGGTLAAIFASLHPTRVRGLIALEGPMHFTPDVGRLERAVRTTRSATAATEGFDNVPGSYLSLAGAAADPAEFEIGPWFDWWQSQTSGAAIRRYWQVHRWALDETPMPKRLFVEIVDGLYRENRFARRELSVGGRLADPRALTAPVLAVADPRSRVVPQASVQAYGELTGSADVQVLYYEGDVGVMLQHVGVLIGESAHRQLWPAILAWIERHTRPPA